jgi:hypothetical protein
LGIDLLGEVRRAFHVGEENGDLLPLALKGTPRRKDLLGEVLRRVGAGVASAGFRDGIATKRGSTFPAEFRLSPKNSLDRE